MGLMDKAKEFLNSEKGEQVTDQALDRAEQAAKDKLGEDKADQIHQVRDKIDEQVGGGEPQPE